MRKKFIIFLLVLVVVVSNISAAYATEVTDNGSETGDSSNVVNGSGNLGSEEIGTDNGGTSSTPSGSGYNGGSETNNVNTSGSSSEPSEGNTEPSELSSGVTVNVSEESITQIAEAVVTATSVEYQYSYQYPFTLNDGQSYIIDTNIKNLLSDYHFVFSKTSQYGSVYRLYFTEGNFFKFNDYHLNSDKNFYFVNLSNLTVTDNIISFADFSGFTNYDGTGQASGVRYGILFSNRNVLNADGTLYYLSDIAQSYTVTFDTGFDDLTIDSQSSLDFVAPSPSKDGYRFDGWYFDSEYTLPYTDGYTFIENTTLYAKWTPYRTVSFVTGIEDFEVDSVKVLSGESYTAPAFSYAGMEFIGVYTDENFEHQFVGGTVVDADLTLYLRFEPIVYDMGALLTQQVELTKGLQVIQSQLWVVLVVGLLYFVYKFFRIFF